MLCSLAWSSLLKDGKYSDLTIVCGYDTFHVHKNIVCPRSEFFSRACEGNFKVSYVPYPLALTLSEPIMQEASGRIELCEPPMLVKKMLQYLYTMEYTLEKDLRPTFTEPDKLLQIGNETLLISGVTEGGVGPDYTTPCLHILMYSLADRLLMDGLKRYAKQRLVQDLDKFFILDAEQKCFDLLVKEIYRSTPPHDPQLREMIVDFTMRNLRTLRTKNKNGAQDVLFQNWLLKDVPEFMYDLSVLIMDHPSVGSLQLAKW